MEVVKNIGDRLVLMALMGGLLNRWHHLRRALAGLKALRGHSVESRARQKCSLNDSIRLLRRLDRPVAELRIVLRLFDVSIIVRHIVNN